MRTKRDIYASELAMLPQYETWDDGAKVQDFVMIPQGAEVKVVHDEGEWLDIEFENAEGWLGGHCCAYVARVDLEE